MITEKVKIELARDGLCKCNSCGEIKDINLFTKDKRSKTGYRARCKDCLKALSKDIADKQRDKVRLANKRSYIKRKYGITLEEYEDLLTQQDYKCYICKRSLVENICHLDHCHESGKIRKFLCMNCNTGIGSFKDDVNLLKDAIYYLDMHRNGGLQV